MRRIAVGDTDAEQHQSAMNICSAMNMSELNSVSMLR